jgi:hypothetical protein
MAKYTQFRATRQGGGGKGMKISTPRPNREPRSITATSFICQIDAIADFIWARGRDFTPCECTIFQMPFLQAHLEASSVISHSVMDTARPDDPEVDFG